jgi:hypothetical protein
MTPSSRALHRFRSVWPLACSVGSVQLQTYRRMYFICPKSEAKVHRLDYEPQNNESYQCASMPSAMLSHIIDHVETRPRREKSTRKQTVPVGSGSGQEPSVGSGSARATGEEPWAGPRTPFPFSYFRYPGVLGIVMTKE